MRGKPLPKSFTIRCRDDERAAWDDAAHGQVMDTSHWARETLNKAAKDFMKRKGRKP